MEQQNNNHELQVTQKQSLTTGSPSQRVTALRQTYPTIGHLQQHYSIAILGRCSVNPEQCVYGNSPSLFYVQEAYGYADTIKWLMTFIIDLSEYSGVKNKVTEHQMKRLAEVLFSRFKNLKISEIMLFFSRLEAGAYGRIGYSSFDPFSVTETITLFFAERNRIISEHESRLQDERDRKMREEAVPPPEHVKRHLEELLQHFNSNK